MSLTAGLEHPPRYTAELLVKSVSQGGFLATGVLGSALGSCSREPGNRQRLVVAVQFLNHGAWVELEDVDIARID